MVFSKLRGRYLCTIQKYVPIVPTTIHTIPSYAVCGRVWADFLVGGVRCAEPQKQKRKTAIIWLEAITSGSKTYHLTIEEPSIMSEAPSGRSPSGRGRGGRGGNPSRGGRGKGNSSRSKRSSGAKEGSAAPSNKATSNVNNDSKAAIEQAVTPKKVVDPVEERVRQMSDQVSMSTQHLA